MLSIIFKKPLVDYFSLTCEQILSFSRLRISEQDIREFREKVNNPLLNVLLQRAEEVSSELLSELVNKGIIVKTEKGLRKTFDYDELRTNVQELYNI